MAAGGRTRVSRPRAAAPTSHGTFVRSLLAELAVRDPDGSRLGAATDVAQAAVLAADSVLDPGLVWVEHLGALYDTDGVRHLLGRDDEPVSRQAVHKRKGLLALTAGSGQVVYPAFQFHGRQLAPGLDRVLAALPGDLVSRWTVASWLVSPEPELDGETPIAALFAGRAAAVGQVAERWAGQLAA